MNDQVYANTDSLSSLCAEIRTRYNAILDASNEFYSKASGLAWHDEITTRAIECYGEVVREAQNVLARLDGSREVMSEQIQYLNEYGAVRIGRR